MKRRTLIPRTRVGLREQAGHLRLRWPKFETRIDGNRLISRGVIQPTSIHAAYFVRIEFAPGGVPKIFIESPLLVAREEGARVPHTYKDGSLCMFHPREWASDRILALTIVPWTFRWLHVYEAWRISGEWDAVGIHPTNVAKEEASTSAVIGRVEAGERPAA
jgi:hypothetical protein